MRVQVKTQQIHLVLVLLLVVQVEHPMLVMVLEHCVSFPC
jgi:DNA-binding protein Fis